MPILQTHLDQLEYAKTQPWFPIFVQNLMNDTDDTFDTLNKDQTVIDSFVWSNVADSINWARVGSEVLTQSKVTSREDLKNYLSSYKQSNPEWFI